MDERSQIFNPREMARNNKAVKKKKKMTGFGLLVVLTLLLCGFVTSSKKIYTAIL